MSNVTGPVQPDVKDPGARLPLCSGMPRAAFAKGVHTFVPALGWDPFVPDIGSSVRIELEGGDPTPPIWSGCPGESAARERASGTNIAFKASGGGISFDE